MTMSMAIPRASTLLNTPLPLVDPLPIAPHDIPNMLNAIEIFLQLVNLPQDIIEARNLGVRHLDRVACTVVLLPRDELRLLGQVVEAFGDLTHQLVEVAGKCCEGGAVEEEESGAGGAGSGARG